MLGQAALAMWWTIAPEMRAEFEHWHAHEHVPERLAIPGFLRASRWACAAGGDSVFVMYELRDHDVLSSAAYTARLDAPTPWSTRMMPHHRDMVRSQCRVVESQGAVTARYALTVRFTPAAGEADVLQRAIARLAPAVRDRPGLVGLHCLRHQPPSMAPTTEQRIRGLADGAAEWVLVACGYDAAALEALAAAELGDHVLRTDGAASGMVRHLYTLAYAATPADVVPA